MDEYELLDPTDRSDMDGWDEEKSLELDTMSREENQFTFLKTYQWEE